MECITLTYESNFLIRKKSHLRYLFVFLLLITYCTTSWATTFTVTNTNDAGAGSLRQAITSALAAGAGSHIIDATGITGTISLQSVLSTLTNTTLTINGPSANLGTLTVTRGTGTFRIFTIDNTSGAATIVINRLTLTNGNVTGDGGGISAISSNLTVNNCTISGCTSTAEGGAINITGNGLTLTVDGCTLSGNTAARGGGISAGVGAATGTATITNTTISGNTASPATGAGGGLQFTSITASLTNCTISGNTASTSNGGAISTSTTLTLTNCTVTANTAPAGLGGGIRATSVNTMTFINTLIVANTGTSSVADDANFSSGGTKTASHSIVGVQLGTGTYSNTNSTIGTSGSPAVVNLAAIANNGGPTRTHRLLSSTPELAVDKGRAVTPALSLDQRGAIRVVDGIVTNASGGDASDIGAYEIGNIVWTGTSTIDLNNSTAANWADGTAPGTSSNILLLAGPVTNEPTVSSNTTVNNITTGLGRTLTISSGNTLTVSGTFTHNGILKGNGILSNSNFTNNGIIAPGTSPGKLSLTGNYNNSTGSLTIELGGTTTAGTDYDQFAISGTATLSGTLNAGFVNGFTPVSGNQFVIMTFASKTGTFATTSLPDISPNTWSVNYNATNVTLQVNSALPLKLLSFTGRLVNDNQVQLNWLTTEEDNVNKFEIEWSNNGTGWQKAGELAAINTGGDHAYTYLHTSSANINYYRLKMIDIDKRFTYSPVVAIRMNGGHAFQLFPNPAKNVLFVQAAAENEEAIVRIIDAGGRKVKEQKIMLNGNTAFSIDIKQLQSGRYFFILQKQGKTEQRQFVKQ